MGWNELCVVMLKIDKRKVYVSNMKWYTNVS